MTEGYDPPRPSVGYVDRLKSDDAEKFPLAFRNPGLEVTEWASKPDAEVRVLQEASEWFVA